MVEEVMGCKKIQPLSAYISLSFRKQKDVRTRIHNDKKRIIDGTKVDFPLNPLFGASNL